MKTIIKNKSYLLLAGALLFLAIVFYFGINKQPAEQAIDKTAKTQGLINGNLPDYLAEWLEIVDKKQVDADSFVAVLSHKVYNGAGIALFDIENKFQKWLPEGELKISDKGEVTAPGEYFVIDELAETPMWWIVEDINDDGLLEIAIQYSFSGTALVKPFYLYQNQKQGDDFVLALKLIGPVSNAKIIDLDKDGIKEILYTFSLGGYGVDVRNSLRWKEVYKWIDGRYQKQNHLFPEVYKELITFYDNILNNPPEVKWIHEDTLLCLKKNAEKNIQGIFADYDDCE